MLGFGEKEPLPGTISTCESFGYLPPPGNLPAPDGPSMKLAALPAPPRARRFPKNRKRTLMELVAKRMQSTIMKPQTAISWLQVDWPAPLKMT
jgi:hypothetical protein